LRADAETREAPTPGASDDLSAPMTELEPGERIGHYEVLELVGTGGMGRVYRALDRRLDRDVAVKVLRVTRSGSLQTDVMARARLLREARAMAQLNHPHVLPVYDVQTVGDDLAIAMELVEGQTLKEWMAEEHDWGETLRLFEQAAEGLRAAHHAGFVHRDFKPSNVLVGNDGRVRVMDFGLARSLHSIDAVSTPAASEPSWSSEDLYSDQLTASGVVLGTPAYMPPEQFAGRPSDVRGDVYSFCVSLWEALYGERPLSTKVIHDFVKRGKSVPPLRPPPRSAVPRTIHEVLKDGLRWDPQQRIQTMDALVGRLRKAAKRRPARVVGWGAGGATLAAAVWFVGPAEDDSAGCSDPAEQLAKVWNEDRSAELARAFEATGVEGAGESATEVVAELDRYAEDWTVAYANACETAEDVDGAALRDRRMRCLEDRRHELVTLVDALQEPDQTRMGAALVAAKSMTPVTRCDPDRVAEEAPAVDATTAARVHALRQRILANKIQENLARYEEARFESGQILADAEQSGDLQVYAEALFHRAGVLQKSGMYPEAERAHIDAYYTALQTDTKLALASAVELMFLTGMRGARFEEALVWEKHARSLIARGGIEPLWERQLERGLAGLYYRQGNYEQAIAHTRRSLEIAREIYGEEDQQVAESLNNLGVMSQAAGSLDEAQADFESAIEIWTATIGPEHPNVSAAYNNLCSVTTEQGDPDRAIEYGNRALQLATAGYGGDHPRIANIQANLGLAHQARADTDEAVEHFTAAIEMYGKLLGDDHPNIAGIEFNTGTALEDAGRDAEARPHYERALAIWEEEFPGDHPEVVRVRQRIAETREKSSP
jgi:tetratricopeptide (TPR) repeat protein/tRNA A-37 threonylcarbamoyl transferase component Bud32